MAARKKPAEPTPVEATTHADTRVNIPTGELAGFVADEEKAPTPSSVTARASNPR